MKRITVHVFERGHYVDADSLAKFLKHHGVDATVVTKHAVQVHPDHAARTAELMPQYKWGWSRKKEGEKNAERTEA